MSLKPELGSGKLAAIIRATYPLLSETYISKMDKISRVRKLSVHQHKCDKYNGHRPVSSA